MSDTKEACVICGKPDYSYNPQPDTYYACGLCVIDLISAGADKVYQGYMAAVSKGNKWQAKMLRSFCRGIYGED